MTTQNRTQNQVGNINDFGQSFSDMIVTATLAASTDTTTTVPGGASMGSPSAPSFNKFLAVVRVDGDAEVFIALNQTAAVPVGATFAASGSELIVGAYPFAKYVKTGDVLHLITAATNVDVSIAYYALTE